MRTSAQGPELIACGAPAAGQVGLFPGRLLGKHLYGHILGASTTGSVLYPTYTKHTELRLLDETPTIRDEQCAEGAPDGQGEPGATEGTCLFIGSDLT